MMRAELQVGDFVRCGFFVGRVEDVATSERRVMLLVSSPKGAWRNHGPEWIEYDPDAVAPATAEEFNAEVERYRERVALTLQQLEAMRVDSSVRID